MTALIRTIRGAGLRGPGSVARFDRVVLALITGLAVLAAFDPAQAAKSIDFVWRAGLGILPFLLLAVAFAGYARATGAADLIARAFSGNALTTVVAASLVGALSPFCSCGVIPLVAALLGAGVPLAPVMAFWLASPIMDPEMFVLTAAGLGLDFAAAKTVAAIAMGLLGGFAVLGVQRIGLLPRPLKSQPSCGTCGSAVEAGARNEVRWEVRWTFWDDTGRRRAFATEAKSMTWFLGKWLALAFFLESLMVAYVPNELIVQAVGGESVLAVPLAVLVGVPAYLNGYAAIPLVAGLVDMGMTAGAALAFMTAGAVSSIPAAIAVFALVRAPVFALYLTLGLLGSMAVGYGYGWIMG